MRRKWVSGAVFVLVFIALVSGACFTGKFFRLMQAESVGVYKLSDKISEREAESFLKPEQEEENQGMAERLVFWEKEENRYVMNPEFNVSVQADVYVICGGSECMWYESYPLETDDKGGCLVGERLAEKLFGSDRVVGEEIVLKDRTLQIRGIIQKEECLVLEGEGDEEMSYVTIREEGGREENRDMEYMEVNYGIDATRINSRLFEKDDMPRRVCDVAGWVKFWQKQVQIWNRNN